MKEPKLSLLAASVALNVSRDTIRRGLRRNDVKEKKTYTLKEIFAALNGGDLEAERIRETRAKADALERENRIADGEIILLSQNLEWQEKVLLAIRQRLIALPGQMASRTNPTDPQFAQSALESWLRETLPLLRTEIAKAAPAQ